MTDKPPLTETMEKPPAIGMKERVHLSYSPAGKTIVSFHQSDARRRLIMGPIGSGKSTACVMELYRRAMQQVPNRRHVRQTRWGVVRNTYAELRSTTIKTWCEWLPFGQMVYDSPIRWWWKEKATTKRPGVDMEVFFVSADRAEDVRKLVSMDLTGAWINECRFAPLEIVLELDSRLPRYPSLSSCPKGITWSGLIADTNPPDTDHWFYDFAEVKRPEGWQWFRQPPAIVRAEGNTWAGNTEAENVWGHTKGYNYWLDLIAGHSMNWIKVHLCGDYGATQDGKPIFPDFRMEVHVAKEDLMPYRGIPLLLGWDCSGLSPALVVCQVTPSGQMRVLDEAQAFKTGLRQFVRDQVKPMLAGRYGGMELRAWGDPAGMSRTANDAKTLFQELADAGLPAEIAGAQDWRTRRESVQDMILRWIPGDAREPALLISPRCSMLVKGFVDKYRYRRVRTTQGEGFKDEPEDNDYTHLQDALQYVAVSVTHWHGNQTGPASKRREFKPVKFGSG